MQRQLELDQQMAMGFAPQRSNSILDIVGYDTSSKAYKSFMKYDFSYDNNVISNAGLAAQDPSSLSCLINIQEQKCIHYLHKYALAFKVTLTNAICENALMLVEGKQAQITRKTLSTGDQRFLNQMRLGFKNVKKVAKFRKQIQMKLDPTVAYQYANPENRWLNYEQGLILDQKIKSSRAELNQFDVVIPLHYIFAEISQFDDKGAIVLQDGNTCQFQVAFVPGAKCLIASGGAPSYTVEKIHLIRAMSPELTDEQLSRLNQSTILYRPLRGYPAQVQAVQTQNSFTAAIPQNTFAKAIYFAFFPGDQYTSQNNATAAVDANTENIVTQKVANSRLFYPGASFPLPVREVILNVGSQSRVFNAYLIRNMHEIAQLEGESSPYLCELQQQHHTYYKIDLDRYAKDLFGSSVDPAPVNVIVSLNEGETTISGQGTAWSNNAPANDVCSFQRFQLRAFVILQEHLECDRGQWRM